MLTLQQLFEFDPDKKTLAWATEFVTHLRQRMEPIVNPTRAANNRAYLYGSYSTDFVRKIFKDNGENTGLDFDPMAILEKIRNVMTAEIQDAGIEFTLEAVDTSATNQRKSDKKLLANRKDLEGLMNTLGKNIIPPYSLKSEKEAFKGNAEQFDQMGLDPNSQEDLDYFFLNFHRLQHEIAGEQVINFFAKINDLEEHLSLYVDDMMAVKALAQQTYVDEITGQIKYKYLLPENVRALRGKKRDYSDAQALSWEQGFSVGDFIAMVGDDFNFAEDMQHLLDAANYTNQTNFSCIVDNGKLYYGTYYGANQDPKTICSYNQFLDLEVKVGYIEFKTQNATTYKEIEKNFHGNTKYADKPVGSEDAPDAIYRRQSKFRIDVMKAYFLATGMSTQKLFRYGMLPYQVIEGANDEYSNFSISVYKEKGQTMVEIARPHIRNIEKAYRKFEWMVNRAKPPGRLMNYESAMTIAKALFKDLDPFSAINKVMQMNIEDVNELYTLPVTADGQIAGGGGPMNYDIANGISKSVLDFRDILDMEYKRILDGIGWAPLRDVYAPQPREVKALQEKSLESSQRATQYMRRTILKLLAHTGKVTLFLVQYIVKYRSINHRPYQFLEVGLGQENIAGIEALNCISLHRYGIFVESFNTYNDRQEIKALAMMAYEKDQIGADQLALIKSIQNAKRAGVVFAYEKSRKERRETQLRRQDAQFKAEIDAARDKRQMELTLASNQGRNEAANIKGQWDYKIEELRQQGIREAANIKVDGKQNEIESKTEGDIRKKENEFNLNQQQPILAAAG